MVAGSVKRSAAAVKRGHGSDAHARDMKKIITISAAVIALASPARADDTKTELAFHYGLLQPILTHGFNAAVDVRVGRLVVSYSHGQGLEISRAGGLTDEEEAAGMRLVMPYSTGFGIGATIVGQLYAMADVKLHRYEAHAGSDFARYSTITVGAEIGWRYFVWRGLYVAPVVRFWPNVWDSAPPAGVMVPTKTGVIIHRPANQGIANSGLFANVLVGWAFDLAGGRR
jgi:hypothetical protein